MPTLIYETEKPKDIGGSLSEDEKRNIENAKEDLRKAPKQVQLMR